MGDAKPNIHERNNGRYVLSPVDQVRAFRLEIPGEGRMESTLLIFSPEGITITGDLCPGLRGVCSAYGYDEAWFAGRLSSGYLCEKFLRTDWHAKLAAEEIRDPEWWGREHIRESGASSKDIAARLLDLDELADELDAGEVDAQDMVDRLAEKGITDAEGMPGVGYDPHEADLLVAIQQRFAATYKPRAEQAVSP